MSPAIPANSGRSVLQFLRRTDLDLHGRRLGSKRLVLASERALAQGSFTALPQIPQTKMQHE
ncbi:protein of unknown function (plasmid) [Cupriavidus taiwanensis]|uniref:Uncharacterized protein n=1 Tax=Cupriavidus taiwanensis TaxID=164546 RepID=A0A375IMM6_9BURK|nr:protein of unknown function [Cupriavidus taiwanensis]